MITDYAGASSRLSAERGLALDPRVWGWQPKLDGAYVQVRTDRAGRIYDLRHRSGAPVSSADAADLIGLPIAAPSAVLHAELECQTEAGRRARETRGVPHLHVFDVSRMAGMELAARPYAERYGALHRWHAAAECYDGSGTEWRLEGDDARDLATGRYVRPARRNLPRVPVVPLARGRGAGEALWRSYVELDGGEGLVAVRLDAPLGARASKRKIKATDTLDAVVVAVDSSAALLHWRGHRFTVSARSRRWTLRPGLVVEVRHDGWYERGVCPRFARILRVREDLCEIGTP